jgi:hypothetical protein
MTRSKAGTNPIFEQDFKFLGQWMGDPNNLELDGMYVPLQEKVK